METKPDKNRLETNKQTHEKPPRKRKPGNLNTYNNVLH